MSTVVSVDKKGLIEYWSATDFGHPEWVDFKLKSSTDLYEFAKNKAVPSSLSFSPNGKRFALASSDRQVRVFNFLSGKLYRQYDESLTFLQRLQTVGGGVHSFLA